MAEPAVRDHRKAAPVEPVAPALRDHRAKNKKKPTEAPVVRDHRDRIDPTPVLADQATLAELALHAERKARLERMARLAEANEDGKLVVRISATATEQDRHDDRLATLKGAFQVQVN